MSTPLRAAVERLFAAVESRDVEAVLALLADDAVFIDPHYPTPRMAGKAAIAGGLRWVFRNMRVMSLPIVTYCESENGQSAAVEVAAAHVLRTGLRLNLSQAFVIEIRGGLVTRLQAYTPYGPGGVGGLILSVTRLARRLSGQR